MSRDVAQVFSDIDAFDPDKFVAPLTPDARFRFANTDPVTGRPAVKEAVAGFFSTSDGRTHHIRNVREFGDTVMTQIDVEYRRGDSKTAMLPTQTSWSTAGTWHTTGRSTSTSPRSSLEPSQTDDHAN